ncbi:unnamed protein product [Rotaria sp. Silwood1]|nr:unnamed protein product [Rotaria sp. Silwood1]CAF3426300.1 unnamed protein product [Rotaria sp. Silwood1]CAF4657346.1 unnamed protein product [Rotaria sp. Silwood1]
MDTEQETVLDYQTIDCILSFFWNLSDRIVIVPWLLGIGLVKTMLECLQKIPISSETARQIISIIHNISRHDEGTDELNKFDGLVILKNIQSNNSEALDNLNSLLVSMAIALLSTPKQIRSDNKRMNRILNQLLQITIQAAEAENHRGEYAFHVSEPLAVLTKLFVDDHSLEYVLSHAETEPQLDVTSTINLFVDLFMKFRGAFVQKNQLEQFTCTALLNILWSISFQDRYKTKLAQNKNFLKTIHSLAMDNGEETIDEYVPRSMESMPKAANGILYNLKEISDGKKTEISDSQLLSYTSDKKPMIMISYAHGNNLFCDRILIELEKKRSLFEIWIDRDHCTSNEDLWEKIALGIKQSNLVLCLLSQEYYDSKSCRKEATFAIKRQKSIIPVYLGEPGDCDWLDIHIAELKYVRFKNNTEKLDHSKIQELLKTIEATIKTTQTQPLQQPTEQHTIPTRSKKQTDTVTSTNFDVNKPLEKWTVDDIHAWFSSYKVPDSLLKLYDFQSVAEMHEYAVKLRKDSTKEFIKYEQRYAKNYAEEELEEYIFNRFKNAIFNLPNSQNETMKTSPPKSSTCSIS